MILINYIIGRKHCVVIRSNTQTFVIGCRHIQALILIGSGPGLRAEHGNRMSTRTKHGHFKLAFHTSYAGIAALFFHRVGLLVARSSCLLQFSSFSTSSHAANVFVITLERSLTASRALHICKYHLRKKNIYVSTETTC